MFDFKRRESLRCLFASVASVTVMDWLLKSGRLGQITTEAREIDDKLVNIRSFFVARMGWSQQEVMRSLTPIGSALGHHITGVLFADAVRWWAAAHRTRQDENKYLRDIMYKGEFSKLRSHFYHGFRNNQLAHFPGGLENNDNPLLTPPPYGFFLSQKEYDDFRSILAHSTKLTFLGAEEFEHHWDRIKLPLFESDEMSADQKEAAAVAFKKTLGDLDEEFLKIPTQNYFPDADNG